jgi:hypothetical protein
MARVSSLIAEKGAADCQDEVRIVKVMTNAARVRIGNNLKALHKNSDNESIALADSIIAKGGYSWDVL